jgi:hypothetical protein
LIAREEHVFFPLISFIWLLIFGNGFVDIGPFVLGLSLSLLRAVRSELNRFSYVGFSPASAFFRELSFFGVPFHFADVEVELLE